MQLPDNQPPREYTPRNQPKYPTYAVNPDRPKSKYTPKSFHLTPFNINTADTAQLKKIRGIGSKLSARIVKFRDKLGGFGNMGQLQEVYGLSPEVIDSLQKYTFVESSFRPQQFNVNEATIEQLRQHPYIGFNLARHIIAYRTQHGPFQALEDLQKIKTIDPATFQKIRPYLAL
jgi:competence ComEA-like helix-hairpin-helix protein